MDVTIEGAAGRNRPVSAGESVTPSAADDALANAAGDFDAWYRGEHPRVVAALAVLTGNLSVASDSVDEAFARALERWDRVGRMESPSGWVYRVALNVSRRTARRALLERRLLGRSVPDVDLPPPAGEVWTVVSALPHREREVVVLRHLGGFTEVEIACCLGISRSTVSTSLRSAHHRLFQLLKEGDKDHD